MNEKEIKDRDMENIGKGFVTIRGEQPVGLSEAKSDAVRSVMIWKRGTRLHHGESV